jgi:hypothetical protein
LYDSRHLSDDSSVGIVTRLRDGQSSNLVRFPIRARGFSLLPSVQTHLVLSNSSGVYFLGVKRPGREAERLPPSRSEGKNECLLHVFFFLPVRYGLFCMNMGESS